MTRDTFTFFEHCRGSRFDHPWRIVSQTCDRCGITYAVGSEVIVALISTHVPYVLLAP